MIECWAQGGLERSARTICLAEELEEDVRTHNHVPPRPAIHWPRLAPARLITAHRTPRCTAPLALAPPIRRCGLSGWSIGQAVRGEADDRQSRIDEYVDLLIPQRPNLPCSACTAPLPGVMPLNRSLLERRRKTPGGSREGLAISPSDSRGGCSACLKRARLTEHGCAGSGTRGGPIDFVHPI